MTLASRISDGFAAVATAINARAGKVGASAFDLAVINGYTGTQAQWLQGAAPRAMTSTARKALTGADLWDRRRITDTDTGMTWVYSTTGGYWFNDHAQVTINFSGAKTPITQQLVTQVAFDTLDSNDDANLYQVTLGSAAAGVKIMRGGAYLVSTTLLIGSGTALGYKGALLRSNGQNVREVDIYIAEGRVSCSFVYRIGDGSQPTISAAAYSDLGNCYYNSSTGSQSTSLQVTRIGD